MMKTHQNVCTCPSDQGYYAMNANEIISTVPRDKDKVDDDSESINEHSSKR